MVDNLKEVLERYKIYKIDIEGKSESSIDQYIYRLKGFIECYNIETEKDFLSITVDNVKNWLSNLANNGNDIPTRNAKLVAIREVYKFLFEEEDKVVDTKILKLKSAKAPQKESKYLTELEYQNYLYNINNLRTYAMVIMFLSTGMRFKEMIQTTIEDIEKCKVTVTGKGNKQRTLYFSPLCLKAVNKYITKKRNHIVERTSSNTNILFISDEGTIISRQSFTKSLKLCAKNSGIEWWKEMSPHKLRHSFATQVLQERDENGGLKNNIAVVRDILGHSNIFTTNTYVHSQEQERKDITSKWGNK